MANSLTPMESFLEGFHKSNPGCTPASFANGYSDDGLTSYDKLIQVINLASANESSLLDLACGDGFLLTKVSNLFPKVRLHGVDLSIGELDVARAHLGSANISLIQAKAQNLPFSDSSFEFILCHMALMLMDDLDQVISEIHRCLKPGGVFAAIVGGKFNHDPIFTLFLKLLDEALADEGKTWLRDLGDPRTRSPEALKKLFTDGFGGVELSDFEIRFHDRPEMLMSFFMLMYDVGLLSSDRRQKLHHDFLEELREQCDSDGKVTHRFCLRQLTCLRR